MIRNTPIINLPKPGTKRQKPSVRTVETQISQKIGQLSNHPKIKRHFSQLFYKIKL